MSRDKRNSAIFTAYEDHDPSEYVGPEKNLLRAILISAMSDLRRRGGHARRARDYFLSAEDDYVFSFRSVCEYLGIDPCHILAIVGLADDTRLKAQRPRETEVFVLEEIDEL